MGTCVLETARLQLRQMNEGDFEGLLAVLVNRVQVGEHSVVGAGSVVLKPIKSFVVAYGSPAKRIRNRKPGDKYL